MTKLYNRIFLFTAALLLIAGAACAKPVRRINQIHSPLFSVPVIVKAGNSFDLSLLLKDGAKPDSISIARTGEPPETPVILQAGASSADAEGLTVFHLAIPADTPEALYDLTVKFSDGAADTQPHSVKVVSEFAGEFDFVHLTDIHFNLGRGDTMLDMNKVRYRILQEINKLNPEFVVFGGDVGLNPSTHDNDYRDSYDALVKHLRVPMFMVPGNHELYSDPRIKGQPTGREYWEMTYGPEYNSFDYGNLHVVGVNDFDWPDKYLDRWNPEVEKLNLSDHACIGDIQWEWLKTNLSAAAAKGKTSVLYTHVPVELLMGGQRAGGDKIPGPSYQRLLKTLKDNKATNILVGHLHMHSDRNLGGGITEMLTIAGGTHSPNGKKEWGFRILHVKNGKITGSSIFKLTPDDF